MSGTVLKTTHIIVEHEHLGVVGGPHWALSPAHTAGTLALRAHVSP